jgi:cobalt-zinc-cadmium efflux system protein
VTLPGSAEDPAHDDHAGHDHAGHDHAGHDHSGHSHGPSTETVRQAGAPRVLLALTANAVLLVAQVIGAIAAGSLALLADSAHQASDVFGLSIALVAVIVARRPATDTYTYGLRQADVLGGALIGLLLCASSVYIVVEAVQRFGDADEVRGGIVIVLAALGVLVNGGAALALAGGRSNSLAIRGALTHLLADALGSLAVLLVGVIVWFGGSPTWDRAVSLILAAMIFSAGVSLLRRSTHLLLDRAPIPSDQVQALLAGESGVAEVHHVHVWSIGADEAAVSAHVVLSGEKTIHEAQQDTERLRSLLQERLGVRHSTLQVECHPCAEPAH